MDFSRAEVHPEPIFSNVALLVLAHGESIAHFDLLPVIHHTAFLAVPMAVSAWVIARTLRRPRPVGIPVQLALGVLAFILTFVVMAVIAFTVIDYIVSRRYSL